MTGRLGLSIVIVICCLGLQPAAAPAGDAPAERRPHDPIFMRWLDPANPRDQTIRFYWEQAQNGGLTPDQLVDLGTMLFERGWPKDALGVYRDALDQDKRLYEAWFRIGLVEQDLGDLDAARDAYRRCLKLLTGHGWCNFYLGLLEERAGHPSRALHYYQRAYKFAPELADPAVNPEVLSSSLQLGALIRHRQGEVFKEEMPMSYLDPAAVAATEKRFAEAGQGGAEAAPVPGAATPAVQVAPQPTPPAPVTPAARPPRSAPPAAVATPPPAAPAAPTESPAFGIPDVRNVSPEARLQ